MTPKTIFTIILKIFGLWLILGLIEVIPQTLATLLLLMQEDPTQAFVVFAIITGALVFYFVILRLVLFKSGNIIDKLSLDKHFDQPAIDINIQQSTVIHIAIIVLGGLIFIDALPLLISEVVKYLQQKQFAGTLFEYPSIHHIIIEGCKLLIGYLLMSNSKRLTSWIEKHQSTEPV